MIILVSISSIKAYRENPRQVLSEVRTCPHCLTCRLTRHSKYLRWVIAGHDKFQITLFRLRCRPCNLTFTLLPDFLIPYFRYLGEIIAETTGTYLSEKRSYRGIAADKAGLCPLPGTSITDELVSTPTFPSYQRIFAWVKRLGQLGESYGSSLLSWLLRNQANHEVFHDLAADTRVAESKGLSPEKRQQLRNAALTRLLACRVALDSTPRSSWIVVLARFVSRILGRIPWRAPPLPQST